ncbi:gamma carbonic anhydrase family protein [Entomospira culicis]|uniref:Gamma carbonic anhydrase family protein n=1 Tax=Entomospira culicis TaxID=2719989 RepID=A0A968L025_9SPIO|nr:gamma carbonic anhydrase family protein [Entomospira culicis]NIZ19677.1 gamma carbonic anhydrase family protein [Entomospira culicis]NIZ69891.1 gamma carbonic anhydrase family protein [Entomospira culicis]WDI36996.1 gamma carbonic anhydrase family protein [Entomospira culicis]WDI38625.1 gamma carbonic anhydrase family protein [Entomospira culicis]
MIYQLADKRPSLAEHSFIAPSADVIGDVRIAGDVSIWFNVTLRGDDNYIEIGEGSNVQDNTVVHVAHEFPTIIGKEVTIGHGAIIHGCTIEDHCLIAMGAIILNGATIGAGSIVAAGAMVGEGKVIPPNSLVAGVPAKVLTTITPEQQARFAKGVEIYKNNIELYKTLKPITP